MSIFDEFGITEETGKDFDPNKGNLMDEGWHTGTIISFQEDEGNYKFLFQKATGEEVEVIFWFAGKWPKQSIEMFGKMRASCGVRCTGPAGQDGKPRFQEADLQQFPGRSLDFEVVHKKSKKLKDDGTPFINANVRNVAPAGSQAGAGTTQSATGQDQTQNQGATVFGVGAAQTGQAGGDFPF